MTGISKKILTSNGFVIYYKDTATTVRLNHDETNYVLDSKVDFSMLDEHCEVVHMEISNKCNFDCSYCYVQHKESKELTTIEWKEIIDNLSDYGIFQVTFGGGEPTLREDLLLLAEYVKESGMNLGMTTNGLLLPTIDPIKLKEYFKQINVSWHGNRLVFERALAFLYKHGIRSGINYCYSKTYKKDKRYIEKIAKKYKAEVLYLVYKPVIDDYKNQISPKDTYKAAEDTSRKGIRTAVDGACAGVCMATSRFADIDSLGRIFPCSFIRESMGNALEKKFKEIWKERGEQKKCPYLKEI